MPPEQRVTMKQIAEKAGVSPAVVSAVVRGEEPRIFVSDATREKVLDIVEKTGYERRRPKSRRDATPTLTKIGVVTPTHHIAIFSLAIAELSSVLQARGCTVGLHLGETATHRWLAAER